MLERRSGGIVTAGGARAEGNGQIKGVAIVFDAITDLGSFREIIRPSAVDRMLSSARDLKLLWNHNTDLVLGARASGTLRVWKTREGLRFQLDPPTWAASHVESVQRGDVRGCSFGFHCLADEWHMDGNVPVREVLDAEIPEITITAFPAYPQTQVSAAAKGRSIELLRRWTQIQRVR